MEKKTIRMIVLIVVAALVVALAPTAYSYIRYGRSLGATMFERQIRAGGKDNAPDGGRLWMERKAAVSSGVVTLPEDMQCEWTKSVFEYDGGAMDWYSTEPSDTVIVYFHGGSFIDRPSEAHWLFADRLAQNTGAQVILPLYPRLPENTADDAYAVLDAFYESALSMRYTKLVFMGDSAGGGMALAFAERLTENGYASPDQIILISPWLDLSMENDEMDKYTAADPKLDREALRYAGSQWAGERDVHDGLISPINGDFSKLGEIILYAGTRELLYPDIGLFAAKLEAAGHDYTLYTGNGMNHVWPLFQCYHVREAELAAKDIEENILR